MKLISCKLTRAQLDLVQYLSGLKVPDKRIGEVKDSGILSSIFHKHARITNHEAVRSALDLGPLPSTPGTHVVDYNLTLEAMIAEGNYDWKNDDITSKRFPIVGKGKIEFEDILFHSDRNISLEDAVKEISTADSKNPWEPAKAENILAYGAKNPEEQRKYPIVGLGSVVMDDHVPGVLCLEVEGAVRAISLAWFHGGRNEDYRFLAVRRKKKR